MSVLPANRQYRNDLFSLLFKVENSWGRENNLVRAHGHLFGIVENFTFPDPEFEPYAYRYVRPTTFMPADSAAGLANTAAGATPGAVLTGGAYAGSVGTPSVRNWVAIYEGARKFVGSVPDVRLLSGHILPFIFGAASNEAATAINGQNWYRHYILERSELPSFTMEDVLFNTSGNASHYLVRRARGCKINRATLSAEEGNYLRISLDEILAKGVRHNISAVASTAAEQEYLGYHSNLDWGGSTQPLDILMGSMAGRQLANMDVYKFSEGRIEVLRPSGTNQPDVPSSTDNAANPRNVSTLAKIRSFRLTVNNNLQAKYWVNDLNRRPLANTAGNVDELVDDDRTQTLLGYPGPTLIVEGHREYELEIVAAVSDTYLYEQLMTEGKFGREKRGLGIRMRFDREQQGSTSNAFANNDYMQLTLPADASGISGRLWGSTFNYDAGTGPIGGMSTANPVVGCFILAAGHPIEAANSEPLVYATMRILVPSCEILVQDLDNTYLASGPIA